MATNKSRRRFLTLSGLGVTAAAVGGCAYSMTRPIPQLPPPGSSRGPVSARIGNRTKLHMFQTGWVAVKREHKAFCGPASLRYPAIMASQSWTEWMPIKAFAIEHPDGLFVVDTGETVQVFQPDYTACDTGTGLFYRRNLQFALREQDELGPQMRRLGLDPDRVSKVIMTHLHSDHMGGMRYFPRAEFLVSETARNGHTGALMCRIPGSLSIRTTSLASSAVGVFNLCHQVTADASISIVPTPGHADGHQSVLMQDGGASVCIVGDAAFSLDQITSGEIGGIVASVPDARASAKALKQQFEAFGTIMLPTHDPGNAERLKAS